MSRRQDSRLYAGLLDRWVIFQLRTETQNSYGEPVEAWAETFGTWAAFEALGSKEFPALQKTHAETTARFRIRYRTGIDPATHRILFDDRLWNIQPPVPIGRNVELQIEASVVE